jgi:hypothetical protein
MRFICILALIFTATMAIPVDHEDKVLVEREDLGDGGLLGLGALGL